MSDIRIVPPERRYPMKQVLLRVGEEMKADIDRLAAENGVSRQELLMQLIRYGLSRLQEDED